MLELTLRLIFSLAVVIGLLLLLARFGARRFKGGSGALVRVVHRQQLGRTAAVAVVTVGSRVLVLGTTDQQVSLLAELDPEELVTEEQIADEQALEADLDPTRGQVVAPITGSDALVGSVLSPRTWRQAIAALTSGDASSKRRRRP